MSLNEADDEVVRIAQRLIQFDTTNFGAGRSNGERDAADYVTSLLAEVGIEAKQFAADPQRPNVIARMRGEDPALPALMIHGHLDVVPAEASNWSVDPFAGEILDGMLWGRGAVDMKDMDAIMLASVRDMVRRGVTPRRDILIAFFADEEDGCRLGSQWMVTNHPEQFAGVGAAISEVGGFSVQVNGQRAYLLQTGEKGVLWIRLTARGTAGHASITNNDSAIAHLAEAVMRLATVEWPTSLTSTTSILLERVRELTGSPEGTGADELASLLGAGSAWVTSSLRNVGNVTMFEAGYKENIVPETASALIDLRFLPGQRDEVLVEIQRIVGPRVALDVEMDLIAMETPFEGEVVDAIQASVTRLDPEAVVLPYLLPAGTDNKALSRLGIPGYGFVPLRLPADFDFPGMFHGVDERIPLESLVFGQAVLTDLLTTY